MDTVVGTGHVGLITGSGLAETGPQVTCADVDPVKIDGLKLGIVPSDEPGLEASVKSNAAEGRFRLRPFLPPQGR